MAEYPQNNWYKAAGFNGNFYDDQSAYSFIMAVNYEKNLLRQYASLLVSALLFFFILGSIIPNTLAFSLGYLFKFGAMGTYGEIFIQLIGAIASIASILVPFSIYMNSIKMPMRAALPMRRTSISTTMLALFVSLGVSVVAMWASTITDQFFTSFGIFFNSSSSQIPREPIALALYAVNLVIIPAIFEEFAFRGVIMQSLRRFGDGFALLCSAVVFAIVHVTPTRMPNAFLMGLVIGYFVLYTGSLKTGIVLHMVHNCLIFALVSIQEFFPSVNILMIDLLLSALSCLVGIIAFVILCYKNPNMFKLKNPSTISSTGEKFKTFFNNVPMALLVIVMLVLFGGIF